MNFIKGVGLYVGGMATGIGIGALGASIIIAVMLLDDSRRDGRRTSKPNYSSYYTDNVRRND